MAYLNGRKISNGSLVNNYNDILDSIIDGSIKSITVPSIITEIKDYQFYHCEELETVNLAPAAALSISAYSFAYCSNLVNLNILNTGSSLRIGSHAFYGCESLKNVILPTTVGGSLGDMCFGDCYNLESMTILGDITYLGTSMFYNIYGEAGMKKFNDLTLATTNRVVNFSSTNPSFSDLPATSTHHMTIHVPASLIDSYKANSKWKVFYDPGYIDFVAIEEVAS